MPFSEIAKPENVIWFFIRLHFERPNKFRCVKHLLQFPQHFLKDTLGVENVIQVAHSDGVLPETLAIPNNSIRLVIFHEPSAKTKAVLSLVGGLMAICTNLR